MSLIDALLLDPVRMNVWIAARTDGIGGSGTQTDPYDGGSLAKFDWVMNGVDENTCVHLGPGTFETAGYYDGISGTYWQAKAGMRIVGSGIDVTTLKLVSAATTQRAYAVGHALSAATVDFFEVCDLTIDCNYVPTQGTSWTAGAVRIMGNHSRVARVKVKNWGNKSTGTPGFVIALLTGNPAVGVNGVTNCGIVDCIAVEPHASAAGPMTVLHVGGVESAGPTTIQAEGTAPFLRNCFVDCDQTSDFTKDFRALSMAWCKGGVVEGNQIHNVKHGGPYQETGAKDMVVRNNVYRNVWRGLFWNAGPSSTGGVKNLIVEGNAVELGTGADENYYAIELESTAGTGAHGNILIRNNRNMFDVTEHLRPDTVCHHGSDMAGNRWRYDDYFRRDGRHIGSCNWFTVASRWCRDLWREPDDLGYEEAVGRILPTQAELDSGITGEHLIDDYLLSRNIARFGLKFTTVRTLLSQLGDHGEYFYHEYTRTPEQKAIEMRAVLERWKIRQTDGI